MAVAAVVLAVIAAGSAIYSGVTASQQADKQADAAKFQQQVDLQNASLADQARQIHEQEGQLDAEDQHRETARALSSIRSQYASSGFQQAGTPLDLLEDAATEGELDAQRKQYAGRVKGRQDTLQGLGFQDDAMLAGLQSDLYGSKSRTSMVSGFLNAGAAGAKAWAGASGGGTPSAGGGEGGSWQTG